MGVIEYFNSLNKRKEFEKVLALTLPTFFISLSWAIVSPVFSIKINQITQDLFLSGIVFSIFSISAIFTNILFGVIGDKVDISKLIKLSTLMYVPLPLFYLASEHFLHLVIVRIYQAFISALFWSSSWIYLRKTSRKHLGEYIGIYFVSIDLAYLLALLFGGYLGDLGINLPFYFFSIFAALSFLTSLKLKGFKVTEKVGIWAEIRGSFSELKRKIKFSISIICITIITFASSSIYGNFMPIILWEANFSILMISIFLLAQTVPALLLEIPMGIYIDKFGWKRGLMIGCALAASAILIPSLTLDFLPIIISSIFFYLGITLTSLVINHTFPLHFSPSRLGFFSGVLESIKHLGFGLGALLGGALLSEFSMKITFSLFSLCLGSMALLLFLWEKKYKVKS
ncbi:MAG: MFS transporter [Candidatus Nanoarchaeia archaeon]|nr:MFS transporter [Candidatus Haiyanarchaeum thermophilum]MCW1302984.1 MFS transporter [Candidatus Haiyanarchaeum thermophilum]MCW1306342.1 MFS transporter [Candidatus Haiyanarchaeum thermophilum]MCW1307148.1 MFS transporter [Candidatus Haiyanarchaeum thermophilum]MCW1307819.1 MFS transporter [Candidatus Haiyanarchaeum thermophilum]